VDISIVIISYNTRALLLQCLESVYRSANPPRFEIWVVDNASSDGSVEAVEQHYPDVLTIKNSENKGFAAANNQALRRMNGRYALLLNSDAVLTAGALEKLFAFMEADAEAGMACGQLLNPDDSRQNAFANFPTLLSLALNESMLKKLWPRRFPSKYQMHREPLMIESCIGACMIVRKAAMDEAGMLDERYFFFMEETDWALTFKKAGWDSYFIPDANIYHYQGQSAGSGAASRIMFYRSRYQFIRKWHPRSYPLFGLVIGLRLAVNTVSSLIADGCYIGSSWSDAAALCSVFKNRMVAL
jgi:GT2 family glycosyltransferase